MDSNDNSKNIVNADQPKNKQPCTPPSSKSHIDNISTPKQSASKIKSSYKTTNEKTPIGNCNRKNRSLQESENSKIYSTPCKSRLDYSAVPVANVDIKACQAEILRYKSQQRKDMLAEKKIMRDEWVNAKKRRKDEVEKETFSHEEQMTLSRLELKKMIKDNERTKKILERKDREDEFLALKEAKIALNCREKRRDNEMINNEREKSLKRQREVEENRQKSRNDKEERRKYFLESVAAAKRAREEEEERLKKESKFEYSQEVFGRKEILYKNSLLQKSALEKVEMILSN
ncbi:hypothetical protein SteCoe_25709 [Stentor coeruleus]|uniref:Uncharacterized protein n=1 Tax=Stentor coeruleus TaxID=5963 RepID=A0A1R2BEJ7_9CILI|nr:hypothetical protein SteCoe_25709 [Stentor coeruleus]